MTVKSPIEEMLVEVSEEGIATLTFNQPRKLNAFTLAMWEAIGDICEQVSRDDDVKVLILTGAGKGFCSGYDIAHESKELMHLVMRGEQQQATRTLWTSPLAAQMLNLYNCRKPTIAAVNGIAGGMGVSFVAACDVAIASEAARFCLFFSGIGIAPDAGSTYLLPRLLGINKALELFYSNEMFDANEALRIGMVTKVVPPDELMKVSMDLARKIARGPSVAIEFGRRGMRLGLHNTLESQLWYESYALSICGFTDDVKEAWQAFQEKRPISFKGK